MRCGYKITRLMLYNVLFPSPIPTLPCKSSTIGSSIAGSLLICVHELCCFFLHSIKQLPCNTDCSLDIKKSHRGTSDIYSRFTNMGSYASQKTDLTESALYASVLFYWRIHKLFRHISLFLFIILPPPPVY